MDTNDDPTYCGIGIRGVAISIDAVVWFALFFVATFLVATATGELVTTESGVNADLEGPPAAVAFGLWLGLSIGYHGLLEWRFGKTVGKYLVGIRVRTRDGSSPSPRASLVRNVLRLVDFLPLFYVVGVVLMASSERDQRLGDRVGDTVVVRS